MMLTNPAPFALSGRDMVYLAAPALLFVYYAAAWLAVGIPRKPGAAVVRYDPPQGVSPAEARYLYTTGSDGRTLAAVIASLSARGCLRVEPQGETYTLTRQPANADIESSLPLEESHALQFLFEDGPTAILKATAAQQDAMRDSRYVADIHRDIAKRCDGLYFTRHFGYVALAIVFTFVAAFALAFTAPLRNLFDALFFTMWILFCGLILGAIIEASVLPTCGLAISGAARWASVFPGIAAIGVFAAAMAFLSLQLAREVSPAYVGMVWGLMLVNLVCAPMLKRMTPEGREVLGQLLGFRQFLLKAEEDRLQRLNAPGAAPAADSAYLPYAIALEVREAWGDHLAGALYAATVQR